jgi:curli biogenesis system outer membrane secretion channel CsgG
MKKIVIVLMVALCCASCSTVTNGAHQNNAAYPESSLVSLQNLGGVKPPAQKKLVAILGFENKSSYSSDKLWDTSSQLLFSNLLEAGYFRVVEWEKMKQLFDWDALSTSSLIKSPEKRGEVKKILLCEYFLSGAVTYFDVKQHSRVSALSKSKTIETTIRVDLLLQDAQTGEYLSAGKGEAAEVQEFTGGMSGGRTGSWDPTAADRALNAAVRKALANMITVYNRREGDAR